MMKHAITLLLFLMISAAASAQVRFVVLCDEASQTIEIITTSEQQGRSGLTDLAGREFPNRLAAADWKQENYSSDDCNSLKTEETISPEPPPPPPPPAVDPDEDVPEPPEKNIEYFYRNKVSFYGNILFGSKTNIPSYSETSTTYWQAGLNFRNGNKVQFGFDVNFQGLGKVLDGISTEDKVMATASLSFLLSYPVNVDKKGMIWVIPEAGIGVDFINVLQAESSALPFEDTKFAAPSFFLRVGVEVYHFRPFFYYGRTMISIFDNADFKFNNIGVGAAVAF